MPTREMYGDSVVKSTGPYEQIGVIRQYVNPAIYVENDVYDLQKKPMLLRYSSHELHVPKIIKVKKCSCALDPVHCPCHFDEESCDVPATPPQPTAKKDVSVTSLNVPEECSESLSDSSHEEATAKVTLFRASSSTRSLRHGSAVSIDERNPDAVFQEWLDKKKKQQRDSKMAEERAKEMLAKEREKYLNVERQNFKQWLAQKKVEEDKSKREKELVMQAVKRKELEEEIKAQTNQLRYQLWLKEKEKQTLEKKLEQELLITRQRLEKQRRCELNAKAYEDWLKNSKHKPKPIPMNQGLRSLKSSLSVSYINPNPWHPNVDPEPTSH